MKFWTQPSTLTADLRGELGAGYVEHVPGIAAAISAAAEGPGLDGLAALAALRPDPAGLHADDASETPAQMLDRLCLRASLSWGVTADRRLALRPIAFADPVETVTFEDVERRAAYAPVASVKVGFQKTRYVQLRVTAAAPIRAGVAVVGQAMRSAYEYGSGRSLVDTGRSDRLWSGGFGGERGAVAGGYGWTMVDLTDELRDRLYAMHLDLGTTGDFLAIEDEAATTGLNERIHWGRFPKLETFERQADGTSKLAMAITDWA